MVRGTATPPPHRQVPAVRVDVLAEQGDLHSPTLGERPHLGHEIPEGPAHLRPAHRRHDAEGARVVAADLDRDPGRMGQVRPDGHRHRELRRVLVRRGFQDLVSGRSALACRVQQPHDPADVVGAEDRAHVRGPLEDELTILLSEATPNGDLQAWVLGLQGLQVTEIAVELVVGVLPDAAGVEDDHVGRGDVVDALHALGCEERGDPLGVVLVHLTPEGADDEPPGIGHQWRIRHRSWSPTPSDSPAGGPGTAATVRAKPTAKFLDPWGRPSPSRPASATARGRSLLRWRPLQ